MFQNIRGTLTQDMVGAIGSKDNNWMAEGVLQQDGQDIEDL